VYSEFNDPIFLPMKNPIILTAVCIGFFFLTACDDDDPETGNVIHITEDITSPVTWESGNIYIIDAGDFWVTSTLTIQPGTIIKFTEYGAFMSVGSGGNVIAEGTSNQPIIFTSVQDDENGGDNNDDGSSTTPGEGDWAKIRIETTGSLFDHCIFRYGGGMNAKSTLEIYGAVASVTNCSFIRNTGGLFGYFRGALDAGNAEPGTIISGNIFYLNQVPLSISSEISINNSNTFHNDLEPYEKNGMNGIFVYDYDNIDGYVTWEETEVPFVIDDGDLWIDFSGTLELSGSVILKFTENSWLSIATTGEFLYDSSNIFTSFLDDNYLGDTNGDGTNTAPYSNYWGGIYFDGPGSYLYGPNIFYNSY